MKNRLTKILSILLSLTLLITVCGVATSAQDSAEVPSYYVKAYGTGDGSSASSPAPTVAAAIATMKANGDDVAGNTVNIYLINPTNGVVVDGNNYHNLPSWRDAAGGEAHPTYSAEIIVQPYEGTKVYLAESTKYGDIHTAIYLGGPTVFNNVAIVTVRNSYNAPAMNVNGKDFTWNYSEAHSYYYLGTGGLSSAWGVPIVTSYNTTLDGDFTVNVNGYLHYGNVYLGHDQSSWAGSITYNGNVTYVLNNNGIGSHSQVPGAWVKTGYQNITFNKNLNVVVKDVSEIGFSDAGKGLLTVKGGVQYMVAPGEVVTHSLTDLDCFAEGTKFWTLNPTKKDVMDLFTFTDTAGTYKVVEGKELIATDEEGAQYTSKDGYLVIPEGTYTIDEYIPPKTLEYYVINGGTGDGKTKETPAGTVKDVIATINNVDKLEQRDTAIINIMQRDDWDMGANEAVVGKTSGTYKHAMTAFTADGGAMTAHAATVIIQSDEDADGVNYLTDTDSLGKYGGFRIGGPTIFRNIKLVTTRYNWTYLSAQGNDVTLENDVTFGQIDLGYDQNDATWDGLVKDSSGPQGIDITYSDGGAKTYSSDIDLTFNNVISNSIYLSSNWFHVGTYNCDINLTVDNANAAPKLVWGDPHGGATSTLNKNLNINIKNAKSFNNVDGKSPVKVYGNIQIMNSSGNAVTGDVTKFDGVTVSGKIWNITNNSGDANALTFTKTAGTYKVAKGYVAIATNTDTRAKITSENYILNLPEAGNYTIELEKEPDAKDYYVMNGGTGDGRSPETPAGTVAQVIASVNADNLIKGDFANINIMQRSDWNAIPEGQIGKIDGVQTTQPHNMTAWQTTTETFPSHAATIILKPYEATTTYLAYCDQLGKNTDLYLYGPTIFEGVTLVCTRTASSGRGIVTRDKSVTFGANVSYGYVNCDEYTGAKLWDGIVSAHTPNVNIGQYNTSSVNNFVNEFTTTIKGKIGSIRLGTDGYGANKLNEDYNVVVDGSVSAPTFIFGGSDSRNTTTFKKNVNFTALSAVSITYSAGAAPVKIEGGLQAIYREGVNVKNSFADVSTLTVTGGIWEIVDKSDSDNALTFTDTAGTFDVIPGFVAVATNTVTGEVTASVDGVLTIPAGKYEVIVCDYYANTGEKLYVYNASEVDVSKLEHNEKEGKLFIGWVDAKTGKAVPQVGYYVYGDILEAKYVDYDEDADFIAEEDQIRTSDSSLRYIFTQNKALTDKLPKIVEYGALTLPTNTANGGDFFVDKAFVKSWSWDPETKRIFTPESYGTQAVKVVAKNVLEESNEFLKYTLCLTNIEQNKTRTFYGACGYLIFEDLNGLSHVLYTEQMQSSLYKAAAEAPEVEKTSIHNAIINYSEVDMTNAYWAANPITSYKSGVEGCADTNPNHLLYVQGGITIGNAIINTGVTGTEETDIFFFTDSHFNYTNEEDIASGNTTLLANYRARTWLGSGASGSATNNIMKMAENYKKIVVGGDSVDFVSDGCHNMTRRLIADKSVNGSIKMVLGNHETMETGGNPLDEPYSNKWTAEEKMAMCQEYWTNDVYYDSEIMKNAQGEDNVMLIYMDNATGKFWERQIAPLTEDLEYARANNVPVLLFMHIPLVTHNENEKAVYVNGAYGGGTYGTAEVNSGTVNYYNYSGYLGDSKDDANSQAVCNLIRQSSDVVKGVINGHAHEWAYTEIVGIDENGNADGTYIPQYNVYGAHYGGAMKVTVK